MRKTIDVRRQEELLFKKKGVFQQPHCPSFFEAHRTVIAQVIDYAKELATWDYDLFNERVRKVQKNVGTDWNLEDSLKSAFDHDGTDKHTFQSNVQENLTAGRFSLFIIGDHVHPNIVKLRESIQAAPHLEFTLGLVELHFYRYQADKPEPFLVVPHIVGKTLEQERAVIRIVYEEKKPIVEVEEPQDTVQSKAQGRKPRIDMAIYLSNIPDEFRPIYEEYIQNWQKSGFTVWFGEGGFSLRIPLLGKDFSIFWSYYQKLDLPTAKLWGNSKLPNDLYFNEFLSQIKSKSPKGFSAIQKGNWSGGVKFSAISPAETKKILEIVTQFGLRCMEYVAQQDQ